MKRDKRILTIKQAKKISFITKWRRVCSRKTYKNKQLLFAQFVWNTYNPNDKIIEWDGNVIHHKDEDRLNDDITNLIKITRGEHYKIHHSGVKNVCYGKYGESHPCFGIDHSGSKNSMYGKTKEKSPHFGKKHSQDNIGKGNRKITNSDIKIIIDLIDNGISVKNISIEFKVSKTTVYNNLRRLKCQ